MPKKLLAPGTVRSSTLLPARFLALLLGAMSKASSSRSKGAMSSLSSLRAKRFAWESSNGCVN